MDKDNRGHYDEQCEKLMNQLKAEMVILLVIGGKKGHGMSACIHAESPVASKMASSTPELLRKMADMIENAGHFQPTPFPVKHDQTWSDLAKGASEDDRGD